MPNRKTFIDRDKYDHSSHSLTRPENNDLQADVAEDATRAPRNAPQQEAARAPAVTRRRGAMRSKHP
jgi:hypothetical protein